MKRSSSAEAQGRAHGPDRALRNMPGDDEGPILRRLAFHQVHVYAEELWNPQLLQTRLGIQIPLTLWAVRLAVKNMVTTGEIVAFECNGHTAVLPAKLWLQWLEEEPEWETRRISAGKFLEEFGKDALNRADEELRDTPDETD